ncbi:MAG: hypothetical protein ACREDO_09610 [Methyloceanibacter sp.]
MPFRQYTPFFGPDELRALTAAFDAKWQELVALGLELGSEEQAALMRRKLAQRILVSATAGRVRDIETLKEQAMRSLAGGARQASEETYAPEAA